MIYFAKTLSIVVVCRGIFKSALSLCLNVERLLELWISSRRHSSFVFLIINNWVILYECMVCMFE